MVGTAALIIGIDKYDSPDVKPLSGCVYDALAASVWLLEREPDARIALHVAPNGPPPNLPSGLVAQNATRQAIMISIEALARSGGGDQLFVFLSGHGFFDAGHGGPLFLTQDYGMPGLGGQNLQVDGCIAYFLGLPFRNQFLFYDACKQPTAAYGQISRVTPMPPFDLALCQPSALNALTACYSCGAGQVAWDGNGKGVLVRHTLRELDPDALVAAAPFDPQQTALLYDWETGETRVDLKRLFDDVIKPRVQADAAAHGNSQTPYCQQLSRALDEAISPILNLPARTTTAVTVEVAPPEAPLGQLQLLQEGSLHVCRLPLQDEALELPVTRRAPVGATLQLNGSAGAGWRLINAPVRALAGADPMTMRLQVSEPPQRARSPLPGATTRQPMAESFVIQTMAPDGTTPVGDLHGAYEAIAARHGLALDGLPSGVTFEQHETGPVIRFKPNSEGAARKLAKQWLGAIRFEGTQRARSLGSSGRFSAFLSPPGHDPGHLRANLQFVLPDDGTWTLGGFLRGVPSVTVTPIGNGDAEQTFSLEELQHHSAQRVEPGPLRVELELPWGSWSVLAEAPREGGEPVRIRLPSAVGLAPLRNSAPQLGGPAGKAIWLGATPERGVWTNGTTAGDPDDIFVAVDFWDIPRLALRTAAGWRVEPWSDISIPEWDLLLTAGRLDAVSPSRIQYLATLFDRTHSASKTDLAVLGLALAYAAQAQDQPDLLHEVLGLLPEQTQTTIDFHALRCVGAVGLGADRAADKEDAADLMRRVRSDHQLPVLRWAAPLVQRVASSIDQEAPEWLSKLDPKSVWSVMAGVHPADASASRDPPIQRA